MAAAAVLVVVAVVAVVVVVVVALVVFLLSHKNVGGDISVLSITNLGLAVGQAWSYH